MMSDIGLDARLTALLAEPPPPADSVFADRIVALAAHDLAMARARRRAIERVGIETLALIAIIAAFAVLARLSPGAAGLGDAVGLESPAALGLVLLALWGLVGHRPAEVER